MEPIGETVLEVDDAKMAEGALLVSGPPCTRGVDTQFTLNRNKTACRVFRLEFGEASTVSG